MIVMALDPEDSAGQGASSHPTQEARLFRPRRPSIRQFQSHTAEIQTHMKGKVVLDNDGLKSGRFGRTGSFFMSHTKGKAVLDHDGLKSGRFGRKGSFFTSHTEGKVVFDHDGLRSGGIGRIWCQKRVIFDESFNGQVQVTSALTSKGFNALRLFTLGLVTITYVI